VLYTPGSPWRRRRSGADRAPGASAATSRRDLAGLQTTNHEYGSCERAEREHEHPVLGAIDQGNRKRPPGERAAHREEDRNLRMEQWTRHEKLPRERASCAPAIRERRRHCPPTGWFLGAIPRPLRSQPSYGRTKLVSRIHNTLRQHAR
jgi:hypothetical protein